MYLRLIVGRYKLGQGFFDIIAGFIQIDFDRRQSGFGKALNQVLQLIDCQGAAAVVVGNGFGHRKTQNRTCGIQFRLLKGFQFAAPLQQRQALPIHCRAQSGVDIIDHSEQALFPIDLRV